MGRWRVGEVEITRVIDDVDRFNTEFLLPDAVPDRLRPHEAWLRPHFVGDDGWPNLVIQAFAVRSQGKRIIVDTCVGNHKDRPDFPPFHQNEGRFLEKLSAAGFARDEVDLVVCTHLHADHIGWNTMREGDAWVPTFPNARYLLCDLEWQHWQKVRDGVPAFEDSVQPLFDADLVDLVSSAHAVTDDLTLLSTPGHTPGHVSVRVLSSGQEALITGDAIHHPVQCAHPEWPTTFDDDAVQAAQTRRELLADAAARGVLVIGSHFAPPTAGHVTPDGDVWRFRT
jgi:glyoxylase-like metal-dependent hydrolase (beta-lactamase superfamily II)